MLKSPLKIIIICTIYSSCIIPTYFGKSILTEKRASKSGIKITNLLIVGVGSTASRVFLENLSAEIIKLFVRSQIQCDFTYAGKIPRGEQVNLNDIVVSQYNSYLILNPVDTSYMDTHKNIGTFITPLPGGYTAAGSMMGNQYKEDYDVELYTNNNISNKVLQAELKLDFDVADAGRYKKIAKEIFNMLLKNGFINPK
jgi:hypothetical protein